MGLSTKREEERESEKVEGYSLQNFLQAPSLHQLSLVCAVTENTSDKRQSFWSSPAPVLKSHLDSSVQTNPNSAPLTDIL